MSMTGCSCWTVVTPTATTSHLLLLWLPLVPLLCRLLPLNRQGCQPMLLPRRSLWVPLLSALCSRFLRSRCGSSTFLQAWSGAAPFPPLTETGRLPRAATSALSTATRKRRTKSVLSVRTVRPSGGRTTPLGFKVHPLPLPIRRLDCSKDPVVPHWPGIC